MSIFSPRNQLARPLGQSGAFRSGVLGDVTLPASAPWMAYSAGTLAFQSSLNALLSPAGYCALKADGILGPLTCGAAKILGLATPATCQSFTTPALLTSGCAAPKPTSAPAATATAAKVTTLVPIVAPAAKPVTANMVLVGGAVLIGAGALYFVAKKKGMI